MVDDESPSRDYLLHLYHYVRLFPLLVPTRFPGPLGDEEGEREAAAESRARRAQRWRPEAAA